MKRKETYAPDGATNLAEWDDEHYCWRCHCGTALPPAGGRAGGNVAWPRCGDVWQYGHWALNRWPGDSGSTSLEPRRIIAKGYGDVSPDGRDAA